ncbi:MAG: NPCBM/NEW2 domain-containing protein [Lachnospiraceae bacterium]
MRLLKKVIVLCLAASMIVSTFPFSAAATTSAETSSENLRSRERFNSDWKFALGNAEGAEKEEYDDLLWGDVALPHSFSIPYDLNQNSFYVGYGWYRKEFTIPQSYQGKRINLEFDGVFQCCSIFINGEKVTYHEGGYSGFNVDITDYVRYGETNLIAVQVDNKWQPDLTPRGGDHQFSGGIYRDVFLTVTEPVHVDWYGTFVWTPALCNPKFQEGGGTVNILDSYVTDEELAENLEKKQSDVQVITEVTNDSNEAEEVYVKQEVLDEEDTVVAVFQSEKETIEPQKTSSLIAQSTMISDVKLWSMDTPNLYRVHTTVYANDAVTDEYDTRFGFRSAQFTTDGFFLNGEKVVLDGVNVHQDHGGWCDAVTDGAFYRDVKMVKEAGFNFIRGSHYPHDTSFADACDELGIAFWSEGGQWSIGGFKANDDISGTYADWFHSAYPMSEEYEENFEQSCMDMMENMVRMNRNHPSIVVWSMGNEAFFTDTSTIEKSKALVNKMRNYCHKLDPTRKAGMGGTQRNGYNDITVCDVAGGNGDGATAKYTNYTLPHLVAEYASTIAERNNAEPELKFGSIQTSAGSTITVNGKEISQYTKYEKEGYVHESNGNQLYLPTGSSGLSLWCMFHHGSVGNKNLRTMGIVDYYRLPLKSWYTYREVNTGVPRVDSTDGTATKMTIEPVFTKPDQTTLPNDGSDDVQLIVTLQNDSGEWVSDSTGIKLEVVDGPGVFPGGKTYTMVDGKTFMDGKGAIEFRSYYAGTTTIQASAPDRSDLEPVTLEIVTEDVVGNHAASAEPDDFMGEMAELDDSSSVPEPYVYGKEDAAFNRQTGNTSSAKEGHAPLLAVDGDDSTYWEAATSDNNQYWEISLENTYDVYKMSLDFGEEVYPYRIETKAPDASEWSLLTEYKTEAELTNRPEEEVVEGRTVLDLRVSFPDMPDGKYPRIYTCHIYGVPHKRIPYQMTGTYLSDIPTSYVAVGWGTYRTDRAIGDNPITLDGKVYEKGIGTHADSEVVFHLNGKYTRFQATIGIDDETTRATGSAYFRAYATYYDEISGKDVEVQILNQLISGTETQKINLSIDQATQLRLVTDKNGSASCDHTDWAGAKLLGASRDISLTKDSLDTNASVEVVLQIASGELSEEEAIQAGYDLTSLDQNGSNTITAVDALLLLMSGADNVAKFVTTTSTNMTAPKAGEDFEVNVAVKSKTVETYDCISELSIYDGNDTLLGTVSDQVTLKKGTSDYMDLSYAVPSSAADCYAVLVLKDQNGYALSEKQLFDGVPYCYVADSDEDDSLAVARDIYTLSKSFATELTLTSSVTLPVTGTNGSTITWKSDKEEIVSSSGVVTRPSDADAVVTLTATVAKGNASQTYVITCTIPKAEEADPNQIVLGTAVKTYAKGASFDASNLTDGDLGTKISVDRNDKGNYLAYIVYDAGEGNTFDIRRIVSYSDNNGAKGKVRFYGTNNSKIATTDPTTESDMTTNNYEGFVNYFSGEDGSIDLLGAIDDNGHTDGNNDKTLIVTDTSETTQYRYFVVALNSWSTTELNEVMVYSTTE